jgi:hypothetical protein
MYGMQLWYKGQVSLVKQLQTAQNKAIQIITGAFRTTLHTPLHQLMAIYPIDIHIKLLMKNSALRLYRLPRNSQPLKCLGANWSSYSKNDLPLLCTAPYYRVTHSQLITLACLVLSLGPRLRPHTLAPWQLCCWDDQLTQDPQVHREDDCKTWITALQSDLSPDMDSFLVIYC